MEWEEFPECYMKNVELYVNWNEYKSCSFFLDSYFLQFHLQIWDALPEILKVGQQDSFLIQRARNKVRVDRTSLLDRVEPKQIIHIMQYTCLLRWLAWSGKFLSQLWFIVQSFQGDIWGWKQIKHKTYMQQNQGSIGYRILECPSGGVLWSTSGCILPHICKFVVLVVFWRMNVLIPVGRRHEK